MEFNGIQWNSIEYREIQRNTEEFQGVQWDYLHNSIEFNKIQVEFMGNKWN